MKRAIILFTFLIAIVLNSFAFVDSYTLDREDLPEKAQEFLTKYFPKAKIGMIKIDRHLLKKTDYDVRLVNGTTIEFSNKGNWKSVDCGSKEVPKDIVPSVIRKYVEKNYPDTKIVKIKSSTSNYDVLLSDGVTLQFNKLGQLKKVGLENAPD